jgi:ferrous iron transport protein B
MKHTLLKGEAAPFVMELPTYHLPTLKGVLIRTWERLKSFILRAGKVIVVMVMVLSLLNSIGTDGSIGNEDSENSILSSVSQTVTPVFAPWAFPKKTGPPPSAFSPASSPKKPSSAPSIPSTPSWVRMKPPSPLG